YSLDNELKNNNNTFTTYIDMQYYDDNIVLRSLDDQILYYSLVVQRGPEYGLIINKNKSKLILENENTLNNHKKQINKLFLSENINFNGNIDTLGIPHGEENFINTKLMEKTLKWRKELKLIFILEDCHIKFYLLMKYQNVSKMNYILRNIYINSKSEFFKNLKELKNQI